MVIVIEHEGQTTDEIDFKVWILYEVTSDRFFQISTDLEKNGGKSVQLVRGVSFPSGFL